MIPLIAVVDPHYVGHESIRDEVGSDYEVSAAIGFSEAQALIAAAELPLVVAPETLEPEAGRVVLARLKAAGHRFIGVLLVDEAAALPRPTPDSGVTHVAFRPLRQGEFRRHIDAAAVTRATILGASVEATGLRQALSQVARRLASFDGLDANAVGAFAHRARQALITASRPLELAWLDPVDVLSDAARGVIDLWSKRSDVRHVQIQTAFDHDLAARRPRLEGDGRALREAFAAVIDNAVRHAPKESVVLALGCEPWRVDDRHGWLFVIEDDGMAFGGLPTPSSRHFGIECIQTIVARHHGTVAFEAGAVGWRVTIWLPERHE